jgi:DNA ligase-4
MYGLKEKAIGRLLVKLMKIDKNSEDGYNLLNWKLPGQSTASRMAGDFAGRCFEVLSKRPMRTTYGTMRIAEVNQLLDELSAAPKEDSQLPIFQIFYNRMNPEELLWLIRIILRQMKVGASEKTFLDLWHPDGETLFNVSSSLRRVCWELTDPNVRLEGDETGISLMQCFQPQLAQFQMHSFQRMVDNMRPTPDDPEFWIEEKLDGERMQMHMLEDPDWPGGRRFGFWSRKAKDYTYLYGSGFEDENGAITRHIKNAFTKGVRNLILDGEMITWDPEADMMVPFGTLKTAALSEQRNPFAGSGPRPLFRVFDLLYLNDEPLTRYTLRDRRGALERVVVDVHRRLEKHAYTPATSVQAIEPLLRKVVAEASEGLVLKNPRSIYRLNSRNDDWQKVKPEYMADFGESLDCVVVGGYYGSGHRGGRLSSFLCGLRIDQNQIRRGSNPEQCYSFFKVGGGFKAEDYATIRHHTDGKWQDYDKHNPPREYIELAGGKLQHEAPDVWIRPSQSVVISVKAAEVTPSESFATLYTLRFPRFRRLRLDKRWDQALSMQEFTDLKQRMEEESKEKEFKVDDRRKRATKRARRELVIAGNEKAATFKGPVTKAFEGMNFCVLSESSQKPKKSKADLEAIIKSNGGTISQNPMATEDMYVIAEKKVVRVASIIKAGSRSVVKPKWVFDAIKQVEKDQEVGRQNFVVPWEPAHMFFVRPEEAEFVNENVDEFGDPWVRDLDADDLKGILEEMPKGEDETALEIDSLVRELRSPEGTATHQDARGTLFRGTTVYFDQSETPEIHDMDDDRIATLMARNAVQFAGGNLASDTSDKSVTHVVIEPSSENLAEVRASMSHRRPLPRLVTRAWVTESWAEGTLLDEERYAT